MLNASVLEYLESHRREHLSRFFELLRFPSIAGLAGGDGCERAAEWLAGYFRKLGLQAEIVATDGRPNVIAEAHIAADLPTLLIYGHYDVQPPDPLDAWRSEPFEPVVRDGCVYARGASDSKGQLFAYIRAVEAWRQAGDAMPVNVKFLVEGAEEVGSPGLEAFLATHADRLAADAAVIGDSEFFNPSLPSITYSLRGLAYVELTLKGPVSDVHSGLHGGAVANPINALGRLIAAMHDEAGSVTLPGFYDDVLVLSDAERRTWRRLPFDAEQYAASLGLTELAGGEKDYTVLERRWARPTLDCNGIVGGFIAAGAKTIIPSEASAKVSMRLVPNQDPHKIIEGFKRFVAEHTPPGMTATVQAGAEARAVLLRSDTAAVKAAVAALADAFGQKPAMIRCGASVPVAELIQRLLGLDAVLMGFGLPSDNVHSPNEHFRLEQLWRGSIAAAAMMQNLREPEL
ncbi:MAG: dipeptidase [Planctomycetota bacterium]|nr:dipeptidase [Planctomycetota bacterium]